MMHKISNCFLWLFVGLGVESISTWAKMKWMFLMMYQDYCRAKDLWEEIFRITQWEKVSLEYHGSI